jgi:hypothetical protein
MNSLLRILPFTLIILSIFACKNSQKENKGDDTNHAINADFYGGCYHTANAEFEELLNITVDKGKLSGTGVRFSYKLNDRYQLSISGEQKSDGGFDVAITSTATRNQNTESSYESWLIGEKKLEVKNRSTADFIGDLDFYKINCDGSVEKDSTLFDGFFGFFEGYAVVLRDGKYGLINENWELTIPCKYRSLGVVNEGAIVYYNDTLNRHGVVDVNDNIIIKPIFDQVSGFSEGLCGVLDNGKWGFVDKDGEVVIAPQFAMINYYQPMPSTRAFNEGLANVAIEDAKWGYINPKGQIVIPYQFKFANPFKDGRAKVMLKDKNTWSYIDKTGKCIEGCD